MLIQFSLNKIIGDSENVAKKKKRKKINFRDVNGIVKLINGKSSKKEKLKVILRSWCDKGAWRIIAEFKFGKF